MGFARKSMSIVPLYILFSLMSIVFGMLNIILLIPLLKVIFDKAQPKHLPSPTFNNPFQYLLDSFNYQFDKILIEHGSLGSLYFVCAVVMISVLLANVCRYMAQRTMLKIRVNVIRNLRQAIYDKIVSLDLSFFSNQRKGDLMSSMSNDVQSIEDTVVSSIQVVFKDPLMIIVYFIMLFSLSTKLTLFTIIILPLTGLLISQISKRLKKDSVESQKTLGSLLSITEETISGTRIIKAFNAQHYLRDKFESLNFYYTRTLKRMFYRRDIASPLTEFMAYGAIIAIILYVGPLVLSDKSDLSAEEFIGYIVFYVRILDPAKNITGAIAAIQRGLASGERIFAIMDEEQHIVEKPNAEAIQSFEKDITFNNLSFAYTKGDTGYVLKDINLTIKKGHMVALVGHSGSGKTTLSDMLPRYYDPSQGSVKIDGHNLKDIKLHNLRDLMGVVSQEAILFNDSIYNNIAFGLPHIQQEEVEQAAAIANAHDFIMQTENGYQTIIGDRGNKLSGGQRQRLSIARAVLKNPPILILDEATSALDTESEKIVQDALYKLMQNRTSIVIAHRLSTVQSADMIVVLDKGQIVQCGTHEELITQTGIYKQLNDLQKLG